MKILIDIGHPGHVHFFKHTIWNLQKKGHEILITARNKDVTIDLLRYYNFPFRSLSSIGNGRWGLYREFIQREWALLRLIRSFKPDIATEIGGAFIAPVCKMLGIPSVVFTDSEHVKIDRFLTYPFADIILTPSCFIHTINSRHIKYPGYHELAYLHPKYFHEDKSILDELGINLGEPFIVLRFVAWKASHDIGQSGFSLEFKRKIITEFSQYGKVLISSEGCLPAEFEPYRISLPPAKIHHLLHFARLYFGEGATMATEAALLGTPAIYVSSLVGTMGNFIELQDRYQLVFSSKDVEQAYNKALSLLSQPDTKHQWQAKVERLLEEKIDVTQYIGNVLENYKKP